MRYLPRVGRGGRIQAFEGVPAEGVVGGLAQDEPMPGDRLIVMSHPFAEVGDLLVSSGSGTGRSGLGPIRDS